MLLIRGCGPAMIKRADWRVSGHLLARLIGLIYTRVRVLEPLDSKAKLLTSTSKTRCYQQMQQAFWETSPRDLVISAGMVPTMSVPKGLHAKPVLVREKHKAGDSQLSTEKRLAIHKRYFQVNEHSTCALLRQKRSAAFVIEALSAHSYRNPSVGMFGVREFPIISG